ncbi:hypothetical protein [Aestuariivirga sp.]|uniref:hypothetical protein n=1 Tax=Aestuariivirga sp. TaxID=2650926 RepID=UPI003BACD5EC
MLQEISQGQSRAQNAEHETAELMRLAIDPLLLHHLLHQPASKERPVPPVTKNPFVLVPEFSGRDRSQVTGRRRDYSNTEVILQPSLIPEPFEPSTDCGSSLLDYGEQQAGMKLPGHLGKRKWKLASAACIALACFIAFFRH